MMAHDAIQAIKQLRREIVDGMKALMRLAREKQTNGMLPICDEMINKVSRKDFDYSASELRSLVSCNLYFRPGHY